MRCHETMFIRYVVYHPSHSQISSSSALAIQHHDFAHFLPHTRIHILHPSQPPLPQRCNSPPLSSPHRSPKPDRISLSLSLSHPRILLKQQLEPQHRHHSRRRDLPRRQHWAHLLPGPLHLLRHAESTHSDRGGSPRRLAQVGTWSCFRMGRWYVVLSLSISISIPHTHTHSLSLSHSLTPSLVLFSHFSLQSISLESISRTRDKETEMNPTTLQNFFPRYHANHTHRRAPLPRIHRDP